MLNRLMRCTAGILVAAAFSGPAWAEDSPIRFVSGPLAGVAAENAKHNERMASEGSGTVRSDTATFSTKELFAFVDWARLPGGYHWRDSDRIGSLSRWVQEAFKATGFTVVRGDRTTVNGYLAQYRIITLTGSGERCGVFDLERANHLIQGGVCAVNGGDVPLMAVIQGLSIDNVIGP
ncbi:hypothetical protein [Inquilinus limosus]|uniref:hypothetical protein n=1 Tax=Inquilinus limosus TaxID=171674 RepID=UPI0012DEFA4C|nr:hypothetical protein [Inquilinus limosus]